MRKIANPLIKYQNDPELWKLNEDSSTQKEQAVLWVAIVNKKILYFNW